MKERIRIGRFCIKCDVRERLLKKIVSGFPDRHCIIEFIGLRNNDIILDCIKSYIRQNDTGNGRLNIILRYDDVFEELFFKNIVMCDCEVIDFYFCDSADISMDYFLHEPISNSPQSLAIYDKICAVVCTWVTEEKDLWFYYNRECYDKKSIQQLFDAAIENI